MDAWDESKLTTKQKAIWDALNNNLDALDYGSTTKNTYPLAKQCLEENVRPVDEISGLVKQRVERAGSFTCMPDEWYEDLANHPDSSTSTPVETGSRPGQGTLLHACLRAGLSLVNRPFMRRGSWHDTVVYPLWGWNGGNNGGTPLDFAIRRLEFTLRNPLAPDPSSSRMSAETIAVARANAEFLILSGFSVSCFPGRFGPADKKQERDFEADTVWDRALASADADYGAMYALWCNRDVYWRRMREELASAAVLPVQEVGACVMDYVAKAEGLQRNQLLPLDHR